ncbi:flagellar basal-body MS-ring/collar protein FliF [Aliiroseovarius sp. F47248L]|uniref:flagellar basal-body MS-ring/collar protein FliF n=1 Tax=Aliiroseovarius sp. F47248L TaxID=2926420 RepID=UPI001FF5CA3F|nr:flagellar basal-body MS-ring/collar protein FliF [Aliiroseovarius sp. F47248L]MCK0139580.1 flagellar M-ring protein FliF [Aliiroseovarius sp. F47248L]
MQQITSIWTSLDMRKRIIVLAATLAMFIAVIGLSRMATTSQLTLLYAGLESGAAGDVVKALEARGVVYEIRGGSIFVDTSQRDSLRMTLASEGLPANGGKGYELLDGLSGFGTTSQMFDAAYWRAKEGELARTIVASPLIQNARVHIANTSTQMFRQRNEPSASVTVTTASGALPGAQAKALKFLVASAVPGLLPERVSIIDSRGGLIAVGDERSDISSLTSDRALTLKQNVERLLEARVGFGNAVVELNLETATEHESLRERRFDPETRVAVSTDTLETSNSAKDNEGAGVTVASNLPNGDAASGGNSSSNTSETRERINYEVSETTREVVTTPGAIKRLTVAVLIDGIRTSDDAGNEVWTSRSAEEIASLRELVAGAIGFDEARGDLITIKSLEFEPVPALGSAPAGGVLSGLAIDVTSLVKIIVLAVVALILGLFVLRPIFSARPEEVAAERPDPSLQSSSVAITPPPSAQASSADASSLPAVVKTLSSGEVVDTDLSEIADPDPVERLRNLIAERQSDTVEILRGWMEEDEELA